MPQQQGVFALTGSSFLLKRLHLSSCVQVQFLRPPIFPLLAFPYLLYILKVFLDDYLVSYLHLPFSLGEVDLTVCLCSSICDGSEGLKPADVIVF